MATESNDTTQAQAAPVEQTAAASPAPASTATETSTPPQTQEQIVAEANADFMARFNPPAATESPSAEATDEPGQPTKDGKDQPAPKQPAADDKAPQAQAAEDDPKGPDAPEQMRPRLHDPQDIAVAALAKSKGITLVKAAAIIAAADAPPAAAPNPEANQQPSPVQAQEAKVVDLQRQIDEAEAADNILTTGYQKLSRQFLQESNRLDLLRQQDAQLSQVAQRAQVNHDRQASEARVMADFASAADATTPLGKAYDEVVKEWTAAAPGNPQIKAELQAVDAPERVLKEAALRVLKAPASYPATAATAPVKSTAAAPATLPPPVQPRRVTPAPGSKGQVTPHAPSTIGEVFASIETAEQGNAALRQLYGGATEGRRRGS